MAKLVLMIDGVGVNQFEIDKDRLTIGRLTGNDICIDDLSVSGTHACIKRNEDKYFDTFLYTIEDMGSTNKTFVNEMEIKQQQLHNNDQVRVGFSKFKFVDDDEVQTAVDETAYILPSS